MNRLVVVMLGLLFLAGPAGAAAQEHAASALPVAVTPAIAAQPAPAISRQIRTAVEASQRPRVLPALYVGAAALQGYDAYSTLAAIERGGVEANPLMRSIVENPALFIGVKAGVAAGSIYAAERLWRTNRKIAAVALMVASNSFMTYVAVRNTATLNRIGQ